MSPEELFWKKQLKKNFETGKKSVEEGTLEHQERRTQAKNVGKYNEQRN